MESSRGIDIQQPSTEDRLKVIENLITQYKPLILKRINSNIARFVFLEDTKEAAKDIFQNVAISIFKKFKDPHPSLMTKL